MISRSQLRPSAASASVRCVRPPSVFGLPLLLLLIRSVAVARAVWRFPDGGGGRDRGMVSEGRERGRECVGGGGVGAESRKRCAGPSSGSQSGFVPNYDNLIHYLS